MASSLLDELPCLLDEADELMARLAYYIKLIPSRRGGIGVDVSKHAPSSADSERASEGARIRACLAASETESALKFFERQFLTSQPIPVEKMHALLSLSPTPSVAGTPVSRPDGGVSSSSTTASPLADTTLQCVAKKMHHLMKRVHHWQRATWAALTQFFAEATYLTFDRHRLLATLLLDTLVKYVKVHLLWTSCTAIPSLLAVHTFAQFARTSGSTTATATAMGGRGQAAASDISSDATATSPSVAPVDPSASMYSPLEHVDRHLREYVLCFGSTPLVKIQQDFVQHPDGREIARNLSALALSCFESFIGCHDLAQLRNQGVLDVETFSHGAYAALGIYDDLLYSRRQEDWVLCTALCLPQQLRTAPRSGSARDATTTSSVQLWDFVHVIAQDRLVLPVCRDVAVNIHSLLYQQIAYTLSATTAVTPAPGVSSGVNSALALAAATAMAPPSSTQPSLKKLMSALSKHALRTCADQHAQRAELITWLLQSCIRLLSHTPALVAPLFPVLLAACEAARSEIEWRLCHDEQHAQQLLLPTHVKAKHVQRMRATLASGAAARALGDLLTRTHTLRSLMHAHLPCVQRYYAAFLAQGDADAIAFEIHALLGGCVDDTNNSNSSESCAARRPPAADPRAQQMLSSFAAKERYCSSSPSGSDSSPIGGASHWRREWRQLSVALLANESASALLSTTLLQLMERACTHAKFVESAAQLVARHTQLAQWWWRAALVERRFQQLLLARSGGGTRQAVAILEIVEATLVGCYALDELVEDAEACEDGAAMQALHQRMEAAVGAQLECAIDAVVACELALHQHSTTLSPVVRAGDSSNQGTPQSLKSAESRLAASSTARKSTESRLPSAISSLRGAGRAKPSTGSSSSSDSALAGATVAATAASGSRSEPLGCLVEANDALTALTAAIHARAYSSDAAVASRLAALVEHHVRVCLVRFLRGLVLLPDDTSSGSVSSGAMGSGAGATAAAPPLTGNGSKLRCGLEQARTELQCYIACVQRLFRGAAFVDLARVVLATLASESCASVRVSRSEPPLPHQQPQQQPQQLNLVERVTALYLSLLERASAVSTRDSSALVASTRLRGFASLPSSSFLSSSSSSLSAVVAGTQQRQKRERVRPELFAELDALRHLRALLGSAGVRVLGAAVMHRASSHVRRLRLALEHDRIALIWFAKCADAPFHEAALAVRQMQRLEDLMRELVHLGLLLFFADLLRRVEPTMVALACDPHWQHVLAVERGSSEDGGDDATRDSDCDSDSSAAWQLLSVAFAASFHSELWRRSVYIEALDAADTNAHMSAVALLHLLPLAQTPTTTTTMMTMTTTGDARCSDGDCSVDCGAENADTMHRDEAGCFATTGGEAVAKRSTTTTAASQAQCVLARRVVALSSQTVLALRACGSSELPSPAMLAALRLFAELAADGGAATASMTSATTTTTSSGVPHSTDAWDQVRGALAEHLPDIVFQSARFG